MFCGQATLLTSAGLGPVSLPRSAARPSPGCWPWPFCTWGESARLAGNPATWIGARGCGTGAKIGLGWGFGGGGWWCRPGRGRWLPALLAIRVLQALWRPQALTVLVTQPGAGSFAVRPGGFGERGGVGRGTGGTGAPGSAINCLSSPVSGGTPGYRFVGVWRSFRLHRTLWRREILAGPKLTGPPTAAGGSGKWPGTSEPPRRFWTCPGFPSGPPPPGYWLPMGRPMSCAGVRPFAGTPSLASMDF